ncbi:MAG: hypothetical protein KDJ52_04635 [Anaerolineae bacterium]|nr:hypothetical protein [Anaerolineae bacterium]
MAPDQPAQARRTATALRKFAGVQALNVKRDAIALRPFNRDEFGTEPASPSEAHIQAANQLIINLRTPLLKLADQVSQTAKDSANEPGPQHLRSLLLQKERALRWIKLTEQTWDYYLELFGQRQSRFADWLLASDRIALDCYQAVYTGLGRARSIPAPPPFAYMETGFTPATFRRGVPLTRLGRRANPFPIIKLPYHRLVNPWTLGAIHHEVSHNLQSDLDLWQEVPRRINHRLRRAGMNEMVASIWTRWHKEMWADLCGLLLGGPAIVGSLMDVVARSPIITKAYNPAGVHPTPYLRILINLELLRRMGFPVEADTFCQLWQRLYPSPRQSNIPRTLLDTFPKANHLVVDTICFQPYRQLGDKSLAEVVRFRPDYQKMIQEAAQRIASGTDPGIIPARFLVSAARYAVEHKLARPGQITQNFYQALVKR